LFVLFHLYPPVTRKRRLSCIFGRILTHLRVADSDIVAIKLLIQGQTTQRDEGIKSLT